MRESPSVSERDKVDCRSVATDAPLLPRRIHKDSPVRDYTPMSASSTVEASVKGVSETVTFTITTGASTTTTPTTPTTPDTTTPDPADVTLKVGAAKRPVMYWITVGSLVSSGDRRRNPDHSECEGCRRGYSWRQTLLDRASGRSERVRSIART